jgi:deazaflavin-dependent oxidoreductase (nitroreductase family)
MPLPMTVARLNRDLTNRLTVHFAGRIPPFVLLEHRGRTSGAVYRTPLMLFHDGGQVRIVLTYGERTDWLRNLQAAGGGTVIERGRRIPVSDPVIARGPQSLTGLPRFVRIVLGVLRVDEVVRLNTGAQGEPAQN